MLHFCLSLCPLRLCATPLSFFHLCSIRVSSVAQMIAFLLAVTFTSSMIAAENNGLTPQRWRVVCRTDPSTTATISWDTATDGRQHYVRLATSDHAQRKVVVARNSGRYSDGSGYFHHARVSGLTPDTEYQLTLHSDDQTSDVLKLKTADKNESSVSIACAQGPVEQVNCADQFAPLRRALTDTGARCVAVIVQCGAAAGASDWQQWFDEYNRASDPARPLTPIVPVPGAMKRKQYAELFGMGEEETSYFHVHFGAEVGVIVLDTSISMAGRQRTWLAQTIRTERQQRRWLMACYSAAAYPATARPSRVHAHWIRLLDDFHLDLAFESEDVGYRRTAQINSGRFDPSGTVYLGLGERPYRSWRPPQRWYLAPPGAVDRATGVAWVNFSDAAMTIDATASDGRKIEQFRREPRK
jgi:hypothetical protein